MNLLTGTARALLGSRATPTSAGSDPVFLGSQNIGVGTASGSAVDVTTSVSAPQNSLAVMIYMNNGAADPDVVSVTDSSGLGYGNWDKTDSYFVPGVGSVAFAHKYLTHANGLPTNTVVSWPGGGSGWKRGVMYYVLGVPPGAPIDVLGVGNTGTSAAATASVTPALANSLLLFGGGWVGAQSDAITQDGSWSGAINSVRSGWGVFTTAWRRPGAAGPVTKTDTDATAARNWFGQALAISLGG